MQDGPELYVCRLSEGRQDFANLDLVLDEYTEFTVDGAALHITGAPAFACMRQRIYSGKQPLHRPVLAAANTLSAVVITRRLEPAVHLQQVRQHSKQSWHVGSNLAHYSL